MMIRNRKSGEPEPEGNDRYEGYCKDFADMISREKGLNFEIRWVYVQYKTAYNVAICLRGR